MRNRFSNIKEALLLILPLYFFLFLFYYWLEGLPGGSGFAALLVYPFLGLIFLVSLSFLIYSFFTRKVFLFFKYKADIRVMLKIGVVFSVLVILIQFYNPIIYSIAVSSSDTVRCDLLLGRLTTTRFLGPTSGAVELIKVSFPVCIDAVAKKTADFSLCDKHIPPRLEDSRQEYSGGIGGRVEKYHCIKGVAYEANDITLCDSIGLDSIWFSCLESVATKRGNPNLFCEWVRLSGRVADMYSNGKDRDKYSRCE